MNGLRAALRRAEGSLPRIVCGAGAVFLEPPRRPRRLFVQLQRLAPRGRFGPECEVKERLPLLALQRLSGLPKALPLFERSPRAASSRRSQSPPFQSTLLKSTFIFYKAYVLNNVVNILCQITRPRVSTIFSLLLLQYPGSLRRFLAAILHACPFPGCESFFPCEAYPCKIRDP
ncbi:hypothetical protein BN1002_02141 [Bacillus sp. B-jedd]|nr:hypothetical protein BN1002_02141 [Bacillus sp. B-jedd]